MTVNRTINLRGLLTSGLLGVPTNGRALKLSPILI